MSDYAAIEKEARIFTEECVTNNRIDPTLFAQYDIKRGLRDKNGKGVLAGITNISRIDAFEERDGQKVPCEGKLWYRGYNVYDLIRGLRGKRYAFEGAAYLLLLGDLPNKEQLESFTACLAKCRALPTNFVRDVIMKAPSHDLMNSLTRSVLTPATMTTSARPTCRPSWNSASSSSASFRCWRSTATTPTITMSAAAACTSTAPTRACPRRKTC